MIPRARVEAAVEALLALLDDMDGDENLEDGADDEPSIGRDDREHDDAERSGIGDMDGLLEQTWNGI